MNIADSVIDLVGNTPLVRINRLAQGCRAQVLAKLEFYGPGASVKDRIGVSMILAAERAGELGPDTVIVEPTSGNTGIALAWVCAVKGYRCMMLLICTASKSCTTPFTVTFTVNPSGISIGAGLRAIRPEVTFRDLSRSVNSHDPR